jgi:hypothetical protein
LKCGKSTIDPNTIAVVGKVYLWRKEILWMSNYIHHGIEIMLRDKQQLIQLHQKSKWE